MSVEFRDEVESSGLRWYVCPEVLKGPVNWRAGTHLRAEGTELGPAGLGSYLTSATC